LELSLTFHDDYVSGKIPKENVKVIRYDRMMSEFDTLMDEVLEFTENTPSDSFKDMIKETAEKQRAFKSGHQYDLNKFGLTEEQIRKDYTPIYDTFLSS
jgi:hypothetical protein